jgi:hypothetical protein
MPDSTTNPQLLATKDSVVNPIHEDKEEKKVSDDLIEHIDEEEFHVSDEDDSDENCEDSDEDN